MTNNEGNIEIKKGSATDIDYIGVLNYLRDNSEVPYKNPEILEKDSDERAKFLKVEENGKAAVAEIEKMTAGFGKQYGLDVVRPISWLDTSKTKTRKRLESQMKYDDYSDNLTSICIFVEKNQSNARYRISLDIKNDGIGKQAMMQYHSHLDIPCDKKSGLIYVSRSDEWGNPIEHTETQELIKGKVESGDLRKVQICKCIERKPDETNEYYHEEISSAIAALIPYYDHVVGKEKDDVTNGEKEEDNRMSTTEREFDKNLILYGPPGTGKTYHTAIYAVAICDGKSVNELTDYESVMARYNELKGQGRIAFTTFHQSYGYEEFIEGIKPVVDGSEKDISYTIEPGVFKRFCESAARPKQDMAFTGTMWTVRNRAGDKDVPFNLNEYVFSQGVIIVEDIEDSNRQCNNLSKISKGDWVLLGRDFHIDAIGVVEDDEAKEVEREPFHWQRKVKWLATNLNKTFGDIGKPGMVISNFAISKSALKPQDFYSLLDLETESKPFVFIIDEINRGNISKIFGELITLIENTKRAGMLEAASAILPYSGESFSVPSNVYILGTMNTADRSIALMDTALRRRFQFKEMMPDSDVLRKIRADKITVGGSELDVANMLETINERITFLYDREHTIGHAFFTGLAKEPSIEKLASIFSKSVIPLLQEYFYEDYQKIQLVLGDNAKADDDLKFIKDMKVVAKDVFKGSVDEVIDLPEKKYVINENALKNIQSYIRIM